MDEQVLSVQLDPSRMTDDFDPVPEVIVGLEFSGSDACREIIRMTRI